MIELDASHLRHRMTRGKRALAAFALAAVGLAVGTVLSARSVQGSVRIWAPATSTKSVSPNAGAVTPTAQVAAATAPIHEAPPFVVAKVIQSESPFQLLAPITVANRGANTSVTARLYDESGHLDESIAAQLDAVLADTRDPKNPKTGSMDRRLLQLMFRAAYHFDQRHIEVISAYRMPTRKREGLHALGRAIDFKIGGVKSSVLASYLRTLPQVGVGIYTHRRTNFVHLDLRLRSYHWLDASPPGRTWRGLQLADPAQVKRDTAYERASDWPEGLSAPER